MAKKWVHFKESEDFRYDSKKDSKAYIKSSIINKNGKILKIFFLFRKLIFFVLVFVLFAV